MTRGWGLFILFIFMMVRENEMMKNTNITTPIVSDGGFSIYFDSLNTLPLVFNVKEKKSELLANFYIIKMNGTSKRIFFIFNLKNPPSTIPSTWNYQYELNVDISVIVARLACLFHSNLSLFHEKITMIKMEKNDKSSKLHSFTNMSVLIAKDKDSTLIK